MAHIAEEMLQAYVAGRLPMQTEREVMEHIAECGRCAECFAALMTEDRLVSPPPDLKRDILQQTIYRKNPVQAVMELQERKREKQRELLNYSIKVVFAMAASVLMVVTMATGSGERRGQEMSAEVIQTEPKTSMGRETPVSDSLQRASGKMGGLLSDFLDFLDRSEEEER